MKSKYLLGFLVGVMVVVLTTGAFSAGFLLGNSIDPVAEGLSRLIRNTPLDTPALNPTRPAATQPDREPPADPPADLDELFDPFWEAWDIIHDRFVDQPLDDEELMRGAIQGMLNSLDDPYTAYMDPFEFTQSNISLDGEYEGIGAWVDTDSEYLTIISPMPGSPAAEAGLEPGDEIIAIDGEDMTGIDGNLVIREVLGPAGSTVTLTVRREGEPQPLEFEVTRERIVIPSVESEMLEGDVAYIHLLQFGDRSAGELRDTLEEMLAQDPVGLILDLRFNGGGFLNSAIEITSEFIPEGVILYEEYGDGSRDTHRALRGGIATEVPMVVLINEGSASASEILAGAIQDYERGLLVGTTSFGKGSVQIVEELEDEQGAIRVTIARWLTPDERLIDGVGLEPDIEVPLSDEDIEAENDPQLERAIDLLTDPNPTTDS
jgi:carboxyl-terminal processing protease